VVKGRVRNAGLKDVKDVIIEVSCPKCLTELPLDGWNAVRWQTEAGVKQLPLTDPRDELDQVRIELLPYQEEVHFEAVAAAKLIAPALLMRVVSRIPTEPPRDVLVKVKSFAPVQ